MPPLARPKQPPWLRPLLYASSQLIGRQIEIDPDYISSSALNDYEYEVPVIDRSKGKGLATEALVLSIVMPLLVVGLLIALAWLFWNRRRGRNASELPLFWELCGFMCGVRQHRDRNGQVIKEGVKFDVKNYRWAGCCCLLCPVFLRSGKKGRDEIEMARVPALALGKKKGKFKKSKDAKGKGRDESDKDGDAGGLLLVEGPSPGSGGGGLFLPGPSYSGGGGNGSGGPVIIEQPAPQNMMRMPENVCVRETLHSGLSNVYVSKRENQHSSSCFDGNSSTLPQRISQAEAGRNRQVIPNIPTIVIRESTPTPPTAPAATLQDQLLIQTSNKFIQQDHPNITMPLRKPKKEKSKKETKKESAEQPKKESKNGPRMETKEQTKKEHRRRPSSGTIVEVPNKPKWKSAFHWSKTFTTNTNPERKNSTKHSRAKSAPFPDASFNQSQSSTTPLTALDFILAGPQPEDYEEAETTNDSHKMGAISFHSMKDIFKRKNRSNSIETIKPLPMAGPYIPKIEVTPAIIHSASNQSEWISICGGKGKRYVPPKPSIDSLKMVASRLARAAAESVSSSPKSSQMGSARGKKLSAGSNDYADVSFHRIEEESMQPDEVQSTLTVLVPDEVQPTTTASQLYSELLSTHGRVELDDSSSRATTARSKASYVSTSGYTTTTSKSAESAYDHHQEVKLSTVSHALPFIPVMDLGHLSRCQTLSDTSEASEFLGTEDTFFKGSTMHAPPAGCSTPKPCSKAGNASMSAKSSKREESIISTDFFAKDETTFRSNPEVVDKIFTSVHQERKTNVAQGHACRSPLLEADHSSMFTVTAAEATSSITRKQESSSTDSPVAPYSASSRTSKIPTSTRSQSSHMTVDTGLVSGGSPTSEDDDTIKPTSSIAVEVGDFSSVTSRKEFRTPNRSSSRYSTLVSSTGSPSNVGTSSISRGRSMSSRRVSTGKSPIITSNSGSATGLHELLLPGVVMSESATRQPSFSPRPLSPLVPETKLKRSNYSVRSEAPGGYSSYSTETTYPSTLSEASSRPLSPEKPGRARSTMPSRPGSSRRVASPTVSGPTGRAGSYSTETTYPSTSSDDYNRPLSPDTTGRARSVASSRLGSRHRVASPAAPGSPGRASWIQSTEASRARASPRKNSIDLGPAVPETCISDDESNASNKATAGASSVVDVHVSLAVEGSDSDAGLSSLSPSNGEGTYGSSRITAKLNRFEQNIRLLQESFDTAHSENRSLLEALAQAPVEDDTLARDLRAKVATATPSEDSMAIAKRLSRAATALPLPVESEAREVGSVRAEREEGYVTAASAKSPTKIPVRVSREIDRLNVRKGKAYGELCGVQE
ncbi:hypothetical protein BJ508DRAFT_303068 [Ascobolus immersus RN42]|uniref:Uncharacterized protein n=1 Tax=Ascobolus immersus RN42 TaxID=1160509 RepID=A0A3N4IIZ9_ASCIM|nr:hypothetical protein BJ508DRAFT_303068 [Ascobolus immersus RN42]